MTCISNKTVFILLRTFLLVAVGPCTTALAQAPRLLPHSRAGVIAAPMTRASERSPSEVLLVYNSASPVSTAVAEYYASKRGVTNVLAVRCQDSALNDTNETIPFLKYVSEIQGPVSRYLSTRTGINFIVLTKGIPIRIDGAMTGSESAGASSRDYRPALDSYLAAIGYSQSAGDVHAKIAGSGAQGTAWLNRYYNSNVPFTHAQFGGYLVTRLDGYTQADAMALVDRSLLASQQPLSGPILFDSDSNDGLGDKTAQPPSIPSRNVTFEETFNNGNADFLHAADVLEASGITTNSVVTNQFIGNQTNLLGYFSWGSNDTDYNSGAFESLTFAPGAISNTYVSSSMHTFIGANIGFNAIDLTGMTSLLARVANGNTGNYSFIFLVREDTPSGAIIGTCSAPPTGGFQTWATTSCPLVAGLSGVHDIYLTFVGNGYGGGLYNIEWISFAGSASRIEAASYNTLSGKDRFQNSSEGGLDLTHISNGDSIEYNSVKLDGMTTFAARVASAGSGGTIQIYLDSPSGTPVGACPVPITGGWQEWTTVTCSVTGASGIHNVYLVFAGGGGYLFNLEWFSFLGGEAVIEAASYNTLSGDETFEACSEGGQDLANIGDGQSLMGDLIANGLTGAEGYVGEPTLNAIVGITFNISHYESGYSLAESFYSGTPYLGWEGIVIGDPLLAPYYGATPTVTPVEASNFVTSGGGVQTEANSEGDLDLGYITNGSYSSYGAMDLAGMNSFRARVASGGSGGTIEIRLDSPTGKLVGSCPVSATGGWQFWWTVRCSITATSGTHAIYLVYTGGSGDLYNLEWFAFRPTVEASAYTALLGGEQLEDCSETGQDLGYIVNGSYAEYDNIDVTGTTSLSARIASSSLGGNIQVHLDSPTGATIGACAVPGTGGWQTWANVNCSLTPSTGVHNVFLGFEGNGGYLFNLQSFSLN